jgi:flagellar protein FlbD
MRGEAGLMITLTRLDKRVVVLNADLIKMIEETPDTIITLINGDTIIVRDSVDEVVRRAIDYQRQVRGFQVV